MNTRADVIAKHAANNDAYRVAIWRACPVSSWGADTLDGVPLARVPVATLRAYAQWTDANGEYAKATKADLVEIIRGWHLES